VKTSHANYDVYEYVNDVATKVPAEAICIQKYLEDETHIIDCDIWVNIKFTGIKRIAFHYNNKVDLSIKETTEGVFSIQNKVEKFTYMGLTQKGLAF
jgi:hypothetical protein